MIYPISALLFSFIKKNFFVLHTLRYIHHTILQVSKLNLEFFCIFFCPFLNSLQERESGWNILSFLLNHCSPFIPSRFLSYTFGHFSFFRWQDGLYNSVLEISFYIMYTINMCLICFRKSQFLMYMCVKICVFNRVF